MTALTTALPGGYRNNNGNFNNLGNNANFWSSTENNSNNAWNRKLNYNNANVNRNNNNKQNGFSVFSNRFIYLDFRLDRSWSVSPLDATCIFTDAGHYLGYYSVF